MSAEKRTAFWIYSPGTKDGYDNKFHDVQCSACLAKFTQKKESDKCPNCGADMTNSWKKMFGGN